MSGGCLLSEDECATLWLACVAAYDSSDNPSPDFASVAAVRSTLDASSLVDPSHFDAALAVALHASSATREEALIDFSQVRRWQRRTPALLRLSQLTSPPPASSAGCWRRCFPPLTTTRRTGGRFTILTGGVSLLSAFCVHCCIKTVSWREVHSCVLPCSVPRLQ
jgi:hypothetical protein